MSFMALRMLEEANKIWETINMEGSVENLNYEMELQRKLINLFHVGNFYYYIFDVMNGCFKYINPNIQKVLGYTAHDMTVEYFFSRIHPEDQPLMLNYENTTVEFFKQLPGDKIDKYKFSYDYRIRNVEDKYVRLLQQVITIQYSKTDNILLTLGIHTDISHIKKDGPSYLSFIGLEGEPSYIDVQVDRIYKPSKNILTNREKQVVNLIISGANTQQIASVLFISAHTVSTHRKNILAKIGVKSVGELTRKVIQEGLL